MDLQSHLAETGYDGLDEFGVPIPIPFEGVHASPERVANRELFELELEFVQALANPFYLNNLATNGYMEDPEFINYLKYLMYWQEKEYARFVQYPHALYFLELLQHEKFRRRLKDSDMPSLLQRNQFEHWRTWRAKGRPPTFPDDANPSAEGPSGEAPGVNGAGVNSAGASNPA